MDWLLAFAILVLVAAALSGSRFPRWWLALTLAGTTAFLAAAGWTLGAGTVWDWRSRLVLGDEHLHLRLDAISAWFLALVAVVGGAGAVYARGYWPDREPSEAAGRGRGWWSTLILCMGLVLLCANGLHFLMAWEAFALSAYFLITLERERPDKRAAGWLYLAASHAGTLGLFAFFALLAARTGTWELGPRQDQPELAPLFWVALFGFGVKAGLFPLHIWLPSAHANAPSHVSAIMSGVAISALAVGWFAWVLRPQRGLRWPRGQFPRRADHVERIPETVLEQALGPVSDGVMAASAWVRQRQHGHLPDYILYLVMGLAAVGGLVVLGSLR